HVPAAALDLDSSRPASRQRPTLRAYVGGEPVHWTTKHLPDGPANQNAIAANHRRGGLRVASQARNRKMTETQYGNLSAKVRRSSGKGVARKLRADGLIPAVIYGKGEGNVMLTVSPRD